MGKRGYQGESATDRSINLMDKFIKKSEKKNAFKEKLPARRKDKNVPIDEWPLKDQIEYWENMSEADKFDRKYKTFDSWFDIIKDMTGYPMISIIDMVTGNMDAIKEMYFKRIKPKDAFRMLQQQGILWK